MEGPRRTALLAGLAIALAGPAIPAGATTAVQVFTVPASGRFTLDGHGFGHGHGMSQYGAQNAARQGKSAAAILAFYFPGTRTATATGKIRVLISADTTRDVQVLAQPGLSVTDLGSGTSYPLPAIAGVRRWRLNVDHGRAVIGYLTSAWHRWTLPGKRASLVGDGEFRATTARMSLVTPGGVVALRGALRAASVPSDPNDRDTVDVLSLDNYVRGVISREMPTSWKPAAVRAQAIAARTYGMFERAANRSRPYDICDTTSCQVYGGIAAEDANGDAAVSATAGRYLTWKGAPAFTQFSASDGGWTVAGGFPYLPAKADPYDDWSGNPFHDWSVAVSASVLQKRYPRLGTLRTIRITGRAGTGQWGGPVDTVKLVGSKATLTVSGYDIRAAYGLRSTWFMPR